MTGDSLADPAILEYYRHSTGDLPMYVLVERLRRKDYAGSLSAHISIGRLVIYAGDGPSDAIIIAGWRTWLFGITYCPYRNAKHQRFHEEFGSAERLIDNLVLRMMIRKRYGEKD